MLAAMTMNTRSFPEEPEDCASVGGVKVPAACLKKGILFQRHIQQTYLIEQLSVKQYMA